MYCYSVVILEFCLSVGKIFEVKYVKNLILSDIYLKHVLTLLKCINSLEHLMTHSDPKK